MFSMPPARITSDSPSAISWAAETIACSPEAHILLRVMAGEVSGTPEFMPTWRAGFIPWPAIRMLPTITWSISSTSMPDLEMTSLATVVPRSTAGTSLRAPPKVPTAVLKGVEITISVPLPLLPKLMFLLYSVTTMDILPKGLIVQTFAALPLTAFASTARPFGSRPVEIKRGSEEAYVSIHPLLGEVLEELLLLGGRFQKEGSTALELIAERLDDVAEEVFDEFHVPLLRLARALDDVAVRIQALFEGPVGLFLALQRP